MKANKFRLREQQQKAKTYQNKGIFEDKRTDWAVKAVSENSS